MTKRYFNATTGLEVTRNGNRTIRFVIRDWLYALLLGRRS